MDKQFLVALIFLLTVNLSAFFIMFLDKFKARQSDARRISEGMLFFMATAFGSVGVYAGMLAFRHKTQKWYFILGIPLLMIQNFALAYLAYALLTDQI